jgi:hypothetical protein
MAYSDIALLAMDIDFRNRIAAGASSETDHLPMHPITFADTYQWQVAGAPGFGDAYASAVAGNVERPGNDPSVISDGQILAVIQPLIEGIESGAAVPDPPMPT